MSPTYKVWIYNCTLGKEKKIKFFIGTKSCFDLEVEGWCMGTELMKFKMLKRKKEEEEDKSKVAWNQQSTQSSRREDKNQRINTKVN